MKNLIFLLISLSIANHITFASDALLNGNILLEENFDHEKIIKKEESEFEKLLLKQKTSLGNMLSNAIRNKNRKEIEAIINHPHFDPSLPFNYELMTPLIEACDWQDTITVLLLLQRGAHVNQQTKRGATALWAATYNKNLKIAEILLQRGAINSLLLKDQDSGKSPQDLVNIGRYSKYDKLLLRGLEAEPDEAEVNEKFKQLFDQYLNRLKIHVAQWVAKNI